MSSQDQDKPRIIIDEDWKGQVEREREQLRRRQDTSGTESAAGSQSAGPSSGQLPPASFQMLVSKLATEALMAMGQFPDAEGRAYIRLDWAQHQIDLLAVLQEKTRGNLTPDEAQLLEDALHELRMGFVMLQQGLAAQRSEGSGNPRPTQEG